MEIPDETDVARNTIKTMITEMGIDGGFGNPEGTGPLRAYIDKEVEEKIKGRIEAHMKENSLWFLVISKLSQHVDRIKRRLRWEPYSYG